MNVRYLENPDREFISSIVSGGLKNVPVRTNPFAVDLAAEVCDASPGCVRMRFRPGSRFCQGGGVLQGGIVAGMLDFGIAFASLSQLEPGGSIATASLTVNYLKPAYSGLYEVEAAVDQSGRRVAFAHATLYRDNQTIATATGTLIILRATRSDLRA